jgi:hypothetical protein
MRRSILACLVASASGAMGLVVAIPFAQAQEPLLLRIRPFGEAPHELGAGSGSTAEDEARQARARSEAVWQRAERRSRIAIASVCTGCLTPARPNAERSADIPTEAATPAAATPSPIAQTGTP